MGDPVEDPGAVDASLGHLEMQMRVEVDPIAEGLDGDDDAGNELFAHLSIDFRKSRQEFADGMGEDRGAGQTSGVTAHVLPLPLRPKSPLC